MKKKKFNTLNIWEMITGDMRNLGRIMRYQTVSILHKESVATHTTMTIWMSFLMAKFVKQKGFKVDIGKTLEKALLHDVGECTCGDMVRSVKYSHKSLPALLNSVEERSVKELEEKVGIFGIVEGWKKAKDNTLEGQIVRLADFLSVVSYCQEELQLGNGKIRDIIEEVSKYISEIAAGRGKISELVITNYEVKGRNEQRRS